MAYSRINWTNGGPPAIDENNLKHMDQGIYDVDQAISGLNVPEVKTSNTTSNTATYSCTYTNNALGNKLNTSAVKTSRTTSDSDTYSCTYVNNWNGAYDSSNNSHLTYAHQGTIQCKPKNLYNNATGTNGTVTLSETSANFNYIEIFYYAKISNTNFYGSVKVYSPKYTFPSISYKSIRISLKPLESFVAMLFISSKCLSSIRVKGRRKTFSQKPI